MLTCDCCCRRLGRLARWTHSASTCMAWCCWTGAGRARARGRAGPAGGHKLLGGPPGLLPAFLPDATANASPLLPNACCCYSHCKPAPACPCLLLQPSRACPCLLLPAPARPCLLLPAPACCYSQRKPEAQQALLQSLHAAPCNWAAWMVGDGCVVGCWLLQSLHAVPLEWMYAVPPEWMYGWLPFGVLDGRPFMP